MVLPDTTLLIALPYRHSVVSERPLRRVLSSRGIGEDGRGAIGLLFNKFVDNSCSALQASLEAERWG